MVLVDMIQNLGQEEMEMLGMLISSAEYKALDSEGVENADEDQNQTSIELNVN
jgi:hypothetical protein